MITEDDGFFRFQLEQQSDFEISGTKGGYYTSVSDASTKGLDPNRITAKGYGESRLVNNCSDGVKCSEDKHQLNRRTEIKVISK